MIGLFIPSVFVFRIHSSLFVYFVSLLGVLSFILLFFMLASLLWQEKKEMEEKGKMQVATFGPVAH